MAGLLRAQQIARTPDFQVAHGNFEAGAEFREVPDGGEPLFCDLRQTLVGPEGKVGISVAGGAAHPSPELMKLGQAEAVGIFNNEGVGVGNVQAGFDDGGANQHLNFTLGHGLHHVPQGILTHLTVSNRHAQAGNPPPQSTGALVDGFGAVVQIVHLAAPLHLPADGIVDDGGVVFRHEGLDGVAVRGGLLDGGHVPDAGECHVQRPGDRGG